MAQMEIKTEDIARTENFSAWKACEPDDEVTYHIEFGKVTVHFFVEEWEEFLKDQEEDSFYRDMKQSEGLVVALLEDQPRYVCMSRVSSGFYGGAHGFASYLHYVIRKSDGKIIEPFRDDKVEELGDYIYARLCKDDLGGLDVDMMESAEEKAEFAEAVRSYGVSATPSDAWTDGKSLFIQYQQYEIVPYAYGAPLVTLPMEVARPYLSAELLELLDK